MLALEKLYADVVTWFDAHRPAVPIDFGWREPTKHIGGDASDRVCFTPGDQAGSLGDDYPPKYPGRIPRSIGTLHELVLITIRGYDPQQPENELAQYVAARTLYDDVRRAIYLSAHGTFSVAAQNWVIDKKERRQGATIQLIVALEAMIADQDDESTTEALVGAEIDASVLDHTQTIIIEEPSS